MWIADGWKDYELLDCGGGEKLERWGDQILVRPDPQAIWGVGPEEPGLAHGQRPLQPLQHRRRPLGQKQAAGELAHRL